MSAKRLPKGWKLLRYDMLSDWFAEHESGLQIRKSGMLTVQSGMKTTVFCIEDLVRVLERVRDENAAIGRAMPTEQSLETEFTVNARGEVLHRGQVVIGWNGRLAGGAGMDRTQIEKAFETWHSRQPKLPEHFEWIRESSGPGSVVDRYCTNRPLTEALGVYRQVVAFLESKLGVAHV